MAGKATTIARTCSAACTRSRPTTSSSDPSKESTMTQRPLKPRRLFLYSAALMLSACGGASTGGQTDKTAAQVVMGAASPKTVALAGNAFITHAPAGAQEEINDNGLANWSNPGTVTSAYFRMASAGTVTLGLDARLAG